MDTRNSNLRKSRRARVWPAAANSVLLPSADTIAAVGRDLGAVWGCGRCSRARSMGLVVETLDGRENSGCLRLIGLHESLILAFH